MLGPGAVSWQRRTLRNPQLQGCRIRSYTRSVLLVLGRYLVDRARQPRARAGEVLDVRRRLLRQAAPRRASRAELEAARGARRLREALGRALEAVEACRRCGAGHPPPHGRWEGGYCCGAPTDVLFTDDEVAALRLAGTTPGRLRLPVGEHAGCAFRGPRGCALALGDRPTCCVRYLCRDLMRELHARGDLAAIEALIDELDDAYAQFVTLRAARRDDEAVGLR
jgi:hypothetical protein